MTNQQKTANLEDALSDALGVSVRITIRGEKDFTFSTVNVCKDLPGLVSDFFGGAIVVDGTDHDWECGSFVYATAA